MVPKAEFSSYYGKPILNKPTWAAPDIPGYLFLGGAAGSASLVAAAAHLTGRPSLARASKVGSTIGISLSLVALVHDLGRPSRFLNMLRVVKPTSPMNVGSWLLAAYAPASVAATVCDLLGVLPIIGTTATLGAAATGPLVTSYTAALIANTAVPAWHDGYREMPFLFAASGASAAAGVGLLGAARRDRGPVADLAVVASLAELALSKRLEHRVGLAQECYETGRAGTYMRLAERATAAGTLAAMFARRSKLAAWASGAALLCGSALTRFGIFEAGLQSASDPKYTVGPQRERVGQAVQRP